MLQILLSYWWLVLPGLAIAAYFVLGFVVKHIWNSGIESILRETQAGFAMGEVVVHSVTMNGTSLVEDETVTQYIVEATIRPSEEPVEWACADLYVYGVDEDGYVNRMQIGEIRKAKMWNGTAFEPIRLNSKHQGSQKLKLSIRFSGNGGLVRFNYNFACFGETFEFPKFESDVLATS